MESTESILIESGIESSDSLQESVSDSILSGIPEEIGEAPEISNSSEAVVLVPVEEEELSVSDWGFIGFASAGIVLLLSLGIATILRIFWRSAS